MSLIKKNIPYSIIVISVVIYVFIAQFVNRTKYSFFENGFEFYCLLGAVMVLGLMTASLFNSKDEAFDYRIIVTAILLRLPFLFVIPNLSDDFYRFIWDGVLWHEGINPYTVLPKEIISGGMESITNKEFLNSLFEKMNSKEYYTIYPAIPQLMFYISTLVGGNSVLITVVVMRLIILGIEILGFVYLLKLLRYFHIDSKFSLLYLLNPLLIIESTGNLHHEGVLISFLIISLYQLAARKNLFLSSAFLALSIGTKLLPLMLLPLFLRQMGLSKFVKYLLRLSLFLILLFIPLIVSKTPQNFMESIDLYFQKFEFNASVYYLTRWIGEIQLGYNPIQTLAPILSIISFFIILIIAFRSRQNDWESFFQSALGSFFVYYLFSTIIHPWYIINLCFFCIFTKYRFPIVWSVLAFLSYATYLDDSYKENLTITAIEYGVVFIWLAYEQSMLIIENRKKNKIIKLYRDN